VALGRAGSSPVLGTKSNKLILSPLSLLNGLNSLKVGQKWDKGLPYRKPVLADRAGDLSKQWYISFYYWSKSQNKLVRGKKSRIPGLPSPNRESSLKERYSQFKVMLEAIDILLSKGWTPEQQIDLNEAFGIEPESTKEQLAINEAIAKAIEVKAEEVSKRTAANYKRAGTSFQSHLHIKHLKNKEPDEISRSVVYDWLRWVSKDKSSKTRNNYLNDLSTLFEKMIELELATKNPCKGIKETKGIVKRHQPYSAMQLAIISEFLRKEDPEMIDYIHFIGYAFLRPSEIISLQAKDIDLDKSLIRLKADKAKRRQTEIIPIIDRIRPTLEKLMVGCSTSEDYLFGNSRKPGLKPVHRSDAFSERWNRYKKQINRKTGLNLSADHTLYAMRHTFIQDIYYTLRKEYSQQEAEFKIQPITRHKTIDALRKYIRDYSIEVAEDWSSAYSLNF